MSTQVQSGATRNYSSGAKATWRGWHWNRAVESFCGNVGPAGRRRILAGKTAIYLLGPERNDLDCAIKRGFSPSNCIGIDSHEPNVATARRCGALAVNARLEIALDAWPEDWKVDLLVADFCCGMERSVYAVAAALLFNRAFDGCRLIVNMQRGRDRHSKQLRDHVERVDAWTGWPSRLRSLVFVMAPGLNAEKCLDTFAGPYSYGSGSLRYDSMQFTIHHNSSAERAIRTHGVIPFGDRCYRFDYSNPAAFWIASACKAPIDIYADGWSEKYGRNVQLLVDESKAVKRKITALRAVRSRRANESNP